MVTDAAYYAGIVESVVDVLTSLDVTGYAWDTSDGWTQALYPDPRNGTAHLEAWIAIGDCTGITRSHMAHAFRLVFSSRYQADDDSISQARTHAAARSAVDALLTWQGDHGERLIPSGYSMTQISDEWLEVAITCSLLLLRGDT